MEPSPTWNLQFKLCTQTVTEDDIKTIDNYIYHMTNLCYHHLQYTPEINRVYSLSVFLLHYFLNKLLHFRTSFQYFVNHFLKLQFLPKRIFFDVTQCTCIRCKFPDISSEKMDTSLEQYFNHLKTQPVKVRNYMLSVLEKCFDLQCLHSMILEHQYPHLDKETISNFVTTYHEIK